MKNIKDNPRFPAFYLTVTLFALACNCTHPVTPTMFIDLGFPDYMFGLAQACNQLTIFLLSPFWGKLNEYVSSRKLMSIGTLGYAIAQVMFCYSTRQIHIVIARLFCGCFCSAMFVGQLTYIVSGSRSELEKGQNLTLLATVTAVANAFGYMLGGLIGDFGVRKAIWAQILLLLLATVVGFLFCSDDVYASLKNINKKKLIRESNPLSSFAAAGKFLTPLFFGMFMMAALQNLSQLCFDQSFNYFTKDQFGFSSGNTGLIKGGIGLINLLANMLICRQLMKKTDIRRSVIPVLFLCGVCMTGLVVFGQVIPFVLCTVALYAVMQISIPMIQGIVAGRGAGEQNGIVMGFYNSMKYLGGLAGALMSGFLYEADPKYPFLVSTISLFVCMLLAAVIYRKDSSLRPYQSL